MAIGGIRTGMSFSEEPRSATMQGGAGAAENASVAENFSLLRDGAPKYGRMEQYRIAAESAKRRAVTKSNADVRGNSVSNMGAIEATEIRTDGQVEAAQKEAEGSTFGSITRAGITLLGSAFLSDEKTKNNIEHIQDALATLRELRPVTFYYNEEYSSTAERLHHGFIAQEYAKHMPDATYYDEDADAMCIDTIELIALLVRSVQQLETKVTRMEAQHALAGVK